MDDDTIGCCAWGRRRRSRSKKNPQKAERSPPPDDQIKPTRAEYGFEAGKQTVEVLEKAAGLIPVPFAKEALGVALALINACEEVTSIEEQVKDLRNRICGLMLVIVNTVQGKELKDISNEIQTEVETLKCNLEKVAIDLKEIKDQSRWLTFFFKNLNKSKIEDCISRLQEALEKFQMSRELRTAEELHRIQTRLEGIFGLMGKIQTQVDAIDSKVDEIKAMMNKGLHRASLLPCREMPLKPRHFHGRDVVVADVARLLSSDDKSRVCILGPGGMGKTSVALAVMESDAVREKISEGNRFWVPCIGATSPSLLLQILYSSLRITRDTGDTLADIHAELQASTDLRIILLDNFETPWNPLEGRQTEVEHILCSFSLLPHLAILLTMRSNNPPSDEIEWESRILLRTEDDASRTIYTDIDPTAADHPALPDLLNALGHMPFAITLMAKLAKKSKATPDKLLEMWHKGGTNMLSKPEEGMNYCISLSVDSKLLGDDPEALALLAILSMLPAGTDQNHLDWWAPTLTNRFGAIATLSDAALIVDTDLGEPRGFMISVLPVVQSYMHQSGRISETVREGVRAACYKFVCAHQSSPGDTKFNDDATALAGEETNIQTILLEATRSMLDTQFFTTRSTSLRGLQADADTQLDALLAFSWYQHWSKPRPDIAERTVAVARTMNKERCLAEALFCLGSILLKLDRYPDACICFDEARQRFKTFSDGSDLLRAGQCALELSDAYQFMADNLQAHRLVLEAQNDLKESASEYGVACGLLGLGRFYWWSDEENGEKALENFGAALAAFEILDRPVDAAHCIHDSARCFARQGRYSEALDASKRALKVYERFGLNYQLCQALRRMVRYLQMLDRHDDAMEILPRCLEQCQRLGSPIAIAQTLEEFAQIYLHRRDLSAARAAYQGAQENFESMPGSGLSEDGIGRCQYNLLQLTQMEENPADNNIDFQHANRC